MEWHAIERDWDRYVASAKRQWAKLSEEQIRATRGRRKVLSARLGEAYGLNESETEAQLREWQSLQANREHR